MKPGPIRRLLGLLAVTLLAGSARADSARAVSLAPNLTELVYALGLGDRLVGRSSACDFPPAARAVPVVGGFGRPNLELLLRLKPDVALATDLENPVAIDALRSAGLRCLVLPCESWDQLMEAALAIGAELGDPAAGTDWVAGMRARRERLAARTRARLERHPRPSVYIEVWYDPVTTAGGASFMDDLVALAGGRNIGHALKAAYPHVSSEWVIRENPEVALTAYMLPDGGASERLRRRTGWGSLSAVRNNRICAGIDPDWLLRSGPRVLDGAEAFAAWLWKPAETNAGTADGLRP